MANATPQAVSRLGQALSDESETGLSMDLSAFGIRRELSCLFHLGARHLLEKFVPGTARFGF
jgi:hypothetical protein